VGVRVCVRGMISVQVVANTHICVWLLPTCCGESGSSVARRQIPIEIELSLHDEQPDHLKPVIATIRASIAHDGTLLICCHVMHQSGDLASSTARSHHSAVCTLLNIIHMSTCAVAAPCPPLRCSSCSTNCALLSEAARLRYVCGYHISRGIRD